MRLFAIHILLLLDVVPCVAAMPHFQNSQCFRSPNARFTAVLERYTQASTPGSLVPPEVVRVIIRDARGRVLVADDYRQRDYQPQVGHWSASSRFYVYALQSYGGHSPWHRPFIVADTRTGHLYSDDVLGYGPAVAEFRLSERDTISYHIADHSKDEGGDPYVPGLACEYSLSQRIQRTTLGHH